MIEKSLEEIMKNRIEKLEKIRKLGFDPFISKFERKHTIPEVIKKGVGKKVITAGRIIGKRGHGKISFADLRGMDGQIQLVFREDVLKAEESKLLELLDLGDFIGVEGKTIKTKVGEFSIEVKKLTILTKSLRPLPEKHEGLKDVETRYRQRYVDLLVNPEVREVFEKRTKIIDELREYLNKNEFFEAETPILQPLYGGAYAKPFVTHHNALDSDFYLRIADELYLKRLIVGGWDKVYEFGKDFRNEGISKQHNPEFTMLEFYWAYADYNDLMTFTEKMLSSVVKKVMGSYQFVYERDKIDFKPPWKRITFGDLIKRELSIDIDKVDTEGKLLKLVGDKGITLDLKGVKGYGALLDELYKKVIRPDIKGPIFITDHPFRMRPLAKKNPDDPTKASSITLLVKGFELINAYTELNDPADQRERWEAEMDLAEKGLEEYQMVDEDYIRALEYGMPPTAGWGMGIDRFVAIVTNQKTLKDVILFPTLKPEFKSDGMENSENSAKLGESVNQTDQKSNITRKEAMELVKEHTKNKNLIKHMLAVEAAMGALADHFRVGEEEKNEWMLAGLMHDTDYEKYPKEHPLKLLEELKKRIDVPENVYNAIARHGWKYNHNCPEPITRMDWALYTCDELTGLIVACALVKPEKKVASVTADSVLKKWNQKAFAKGVHRDQIELCEEKLGIKLPAFIEIVLRGMKSIAKDLGL